jgi:hypothetical protein
VSTLDHLVVAAATLEEGRRWVEERVGVPMEPGGAHPDFGTHNRLLSLGPDCYLEVIAVDPGAPPPDRPRWFELDTPQMRQRLAAGPALIHWVVAVASMDGERDVLGLSRGAHRWALTVPGDGRMPVGGLAPSRILWHTPPPSTTLPEKRVRLEVLTLRTPEPRALRTALAGVDAPVELREGPAGMAALLKTPLGRVTLAG